MAFTPIDNAPDAEPVPGVAVSQAAPGVAVHVPVAPVAVRFTVWAAGFAPVKVSDVGDTERVGCAATSIVTATVCAVNPLPETVIKALWVPAARPAGLTDAVNDPEAVPLPGATVNQAAFDAADHVVDPPANVNDTLCGAGLAPVNESCVGDRVTDEDRFNVTATVWLVKPFPETVISAL